MCSVRSTGLFRQTGKPYVLGGPFSLDDPSPRTFDCSQLVEWAAGKVGVSFPLPSGNQYEQCRRTGNLISVQDALNIRGAVLFRGPGGNDHIAISMGDGKRDMAAHTSHTDLAHQISIAQTNASYWDSAGLIPGMDYGKTTIPRNAN